MSWFILLVALIRMSGSELVGHAWDYAYWQLVAQMNTTVYDWSWTIWTVFMICAFVAGVFGLLRGAKLSESFGCLGCGGIIMLLLPFGAWVNMTEAVSIVNSMSPTEGIVTMSKFVIGLVLYLFFGIF